MTDYNAIPRHPAHFQNVVEETWHGLGQFTATRWVRCAYADRHDVVAELGASGGELWPYGTTVSARLVGARAWGCGRGTVDGDGLSQYDSALIQLFYSTLGPYVVTPFILMEELTPWRDGMMIDAPAMGLTWDGGDQIQETLPTEVVGCIYELTLIRLSAPPATVATYLNYCNSAGVTMYTCAITFAAQTLLHTGPFVKRVVELGILPKWNVLYRWVYHPGTWNKKWRADTATWTTVKTSGGTPIVFHPTVNFSLLLPS